MSLRQTPLHSRHVALGAKMADFGGWDMPIEYVGTVTEHTAVRESAGVFDVSHMGYTEVTGSGAIAWLNSVLANDLERVGAGQAQYSLLCDESGGVIDDLIVYRINDDNAFIIPNASNSDAVVATLSAAAAAAGTGITVADKREDYGILAVQGPRSDAILEALGLPCGHDYMSFARTSWQGSPVVVCRTGYTGERGYEVLVPASVLADLWDAVVTAGATPAGLGARDTLRTEMGYPLHGHELSLDITRAWRGPWAGTSQPSRGAMHWPQSAPPDRVGDCAASSRWSGPSPDPACPCCRRTARPSAR
ncbi:MAG: glycine cleavage system aminomethyltransferase GcvT [Candidatus Nanopelagicales bacterium]|nr:glycine cleavage system aminomethyltransferase GcvT [Candidatus Nanopelagicales bacterium]